MTDLGSVHRDEWGRLMALLVGRYRRVDLAEDALADAFESAARTWGAGPPDNPAGWLLTAARRRILDRLRAEAVAARRFPQLVVDAGLTARTQRARSDPSHCSTSDEIADEQLRLVLLCAHPSLAPDAAAALTLRLVLGVSTADLARLFLVPQTTMAARLTRARKRVAGARFEIPTGAALSERIVLVADIAYLAFTAAYAPGSGPEVLRAADATEVIRLLRVIRALMPRREASLDALLALMLLQHSRRDARVDDGRLVLLPDQDRARWHHDEILEAVGLLTPLATAPATPHLLQALIAAEHAVTSTAAETDWARIVLRYDELLALGESPVVRLNRAVALAEADGPQAGLAALDGLQLPGHRLPAVRADLLRRAGRHDEARTAYAVAIERCDNEPERDYLRGRVAGW